MAKRVQYSSYKDVPIDGLKLVIKEGAVSAKKLESIQKVMKIISLILVYGFLTLMAIVVLLPFYWMLITSLKSTKEIRASTQTFFPSTILWSNYVEVFRQFDFIT